MVGMGQSLYRSEPSARRVYDEADELLGYSLSELCFNGPPETLTETINAQPAILTTSVAILRVLEDRTDLCPAFLAGHSLGEFTALVCAGALDFADAVGLVRERARLMAAAGRLEPGGMMAVLGMDVSALSDVCAQAAAETGQVVQIANDNCPGQLVISGAHSALERAKALAEQAGAKRVVPLQVSIAAHSPLMAAAAAEFERTVAQVPLDPPATPVIGNTTASPMTTVAEIRAELPAQLTRQVRWTETIRHLRSRGAETFAEIGPGDVLTRLTKRIDGSSIRFSIQNEEDIRDLVARTRRTG